MKKINHNSLCETETHKVGMTDIEIIKALECCSQDNIDCEECPANGICDNDEFCFTGAILDLIKRQKAEKEAMLSHIKCLQYENDKLQARNREAQLEINRQKAEIERLNRALVTQEKQHELKMRLSKRK